MGVANNLVEKSGSWYSYAGERIGQGKENARRFLEQNPDLADELEVAIFEKAAPGLAEARREMLASARARQDKKRPQEGD